MYDSSVTYLYFPQDNHKYWPELGAELAYKPFTVDLLEEVVSDAITERLFKLTTDKGLVRMFLVSFTNDELSDHI